MDAVCSCTWKHDAKTRETPTAYYERTCYRLAKDNLRMDTPRRAQVVGDTELSGSRALGDKWPRERGDRLYSVRRYTLLGERTSEAHLQSATTSRVSSEDNGADCAPCFRRLARQRGPKCQHRALGVRRATRRKPTERPRSSNFIPSIPRVRSPNNARSSSSLIPQPKTRTRRMSPSAVKSAFILGSGTMPK